MTTPSLETVLADAERYAKSADAAASFSSEEYDAALLELAKREARENESTGSALSRLLADRDPRVAALGRASYAAETAAMVAAEQRIAQQVAELRKAHGVAEEVSPAHGSKDHVLAVMTQFAALAKRHNETVEQCWSRLLAEDATFRGAYGAYLDAAV